MNTIQRALLFIRRNIFLNLVLFIVIAGSLLIVNFMFSVSQSIKSTNEELYKRFGVKYAVYANIPDKDERTYANESVNQERRTFHQNYKNFIAEINEESDVQYVNNITNQYVYSKGVMEQQIIDYSDPYDWWSSVQLVFGITNEEMFDYENEIIQLHEGRTFSNMEMQNGDFVCIVSEDLVWFNDGNVSPIEIGDTLQLNSMIARKTNSESYVYEEIDNQISVKIIGKFTKMIPDMDYYGRDVTVILPGQTLENFDITNQHFQEVYFKTNEKNSKEYSSYKMIPYRTNFILNCFDYSDFERRITECSEEYGFQEIEYETTVSQYIQLIDSTANYERIANFVLIVYPLLFCIILILILIFMEKQREKEIKLLYSLGSIKSTILLQRYIELFIIAFVSYVVALFVGKMYQSTIIQSLLNYNHVEVNQIDAYLNISLIEVKNAIMIQQFDIVQFTVISVVLLFVVCIILFVCSFYINKNYKKNI